MDNSAEIKTSQPVNVALASEGAAAIADSEFFGSNYTAGYGVYREQVR